jgi:drug/metabolite transporter (DMT)-like permease
MRLKKILAFACVYIIWGSTFLAIYYAIQRIPPFFMAGTRFLVSGIALITYSYLQGTPLPKGKSLIYATITGFLLFFTGNGLLAWSEQYIPSGLASLIAATVPLWIVIAGWVVYRKVELNLETGFGLLLGFAGVGLLSGADRLIFNESLELKSFQLIAMGVLVFGSASWGLGSVLAKKLPVSTSLTMGFGFQIVIGGVLLIATGLIMGEATELNIREIDLLSFSSWLYLIVFGTLVANTAYMWLLKVENPVIVGTYAYVNPLIAVILGSVFVNEPVGLRTWIAFLFIISAVFLVNRKSFSNYLKNKKAG